MRRRWTRVLGFPLRVALPVLLGAVTTALVTWGCHRWSTVKGAVIQRGVFIAGNGVWRGELAERGGSSRYEWAGLQVLPEPLSPPAQRRTIDSYTRHPVATPVGTPVAPGLVGPPWWSTHRTLAREEMRAGNLFGCEEARGLPFRAVRTRVQTRAVPGTFTNMTAGGTTYAVPATIDLFDRYRPLWRGVAADTLAWGAVWWAILVLAGPVRAAWVRSRLLRRGRCPRCRYDLLGDFTAGCPECGWNRSAGPPRQTGTPDAVRAAL